MQQIALPSIDEPQREPVITQPFPLVRRRPADESARARPRKFLAGLLFGVSMSLTLALLGYEARIYSDQHPELLENARNTLRAWVP